MEKQQKKIINELNLIIDQSNENNKIIAEQNDQLKNINYQNKKINNSIEISNWYLNLINSYQIYKTFNKVNIENNTYAEKDKTVIKPHNIKNNYKNDFYDTASEQLKCIKEIHTSISDQLDNQNKNLDNIDQNVNNNTNSMIYLINKIKKNI